MAVIELVGLVFRVLLVVVPLLNLVVNVPVVNPSVLKLPLLKGVWLLAVPED